MGANSKIIAFAFLFSNVEKADSGLADLQHITAVDVSQQSELVQLGGFAIHVGAYIEHQHRLSRILGGEEGSNGRPVNPGQTTETEDR